MAYQQYHHESLKSRIKAAYWGLTLKTWNLSASEAVRSRSFAGYLIHYLSTASSPPHPLVLMFSIELGNELYAAIETALDDC